MNNQVVWLVSHEEKDWCISKAPEYIFDSLSKAKTYVENAGSVEYHSPIVWKEHSDDCWIGRYTTTINGHSWDEIVFVYSMEVK